MPTPADHWPLADDEGEIIWYTPTPHEPLPNPIGHSHDVNQVPRTAGEHHAARNGGYPLLAPPDLLNAFLARRAATEHDPPAEHDDISPVRVDLVRHVAKALDALRTRHVALLYARYIALRPDGRRYTHSEVATALGYASADSVRRTLGRAEAVLAAELREQGVLRSGESRLRHWTAGTGRA